MLVLQCLCLAASLLGGSLESQLPGQGTAGEWASEWVKCMRLWAAVDKEWMRISMERGEGRSESPLMAVADSDKGRPRLTVPGT